MKNDLIQALNDSCTELITAAEALPNNLSATRPAADRWSALDCVEHLVLSERNLIPRLEGAGQNPEGKPDAERDASFANRLPNRSVKVAAPDATSPKGTFANIQDALAEFRSVRARSIDYVRQQGDALYQRSLTHPVFGAINGAEMARLTAFHSSRHADQIREIQQQLAGK